MPGPNKRWDDEEDESSSSSAESTALPVGGPVGAVRRGKFDDEEAEDSDVADDWDAEDSEVEREKAKKAAEAKAAADAAAAANKKSKTQRIAERISERARERAAAEEDSSDEETEAQKRERLRRTEKESDLRHAQDLFADVGTISSRKAVTPGSAVMIGKDPNNTVDLSSLPVFNPSTKTQFEHLRNTIVPILANSSKKPHYVLFLQEFAKQLAKDLPSDQIKKIASTLTALSNEKMKEEKAADKGGKKSKAAKTKTTLAGVGRNGAGPAVADVQVYDDAFGDDDFM